MEPINQAQETVLPSVEVLSVPPEAPSKGASAAVNPTTIAAEVAANAPPVLRTERNRSRNVPKNELKHPLPKVTSVLPTLGDVPGIDRGHVYSVFVSDVRKWLKQHEDFRTWRIANANTGFAKTSEFPGESARNIQDMARKILASPGYVEAWVTWALKCHRTWNPAKMAAMIESATLYSCWVSEVLGLPPEEPDAPANS